MEACGNIINRTDSECIKNGDPLSNVIKRIDSDCYTTETLGIIPSIELTKSAIETETRGVIAST